MMDKDKHFQRVDTLEKKGHTFGVTTKLYKEPFGQDHYLEELTEEKVVQGLILFLTIKN